MTTAPEPQTTERPTLPTPEEQRRINQQWMEAHIARYQALRKQYEELEARVEQLARHLNFTFED